MKNIKNRIGERKVMNCGEECEIVEYVNNSNIIVRFLNTGEIIKSAYKEFRIGTIKSRFASSIYGIGIIGLETTKENGNLLKQYQIWHEMLRRCYNEKYQQKHPTYKECKICDEWKYYKNFKKWYDENYYEIDNETMCLDKDILNKGNKIYSPETCVFVPQSINKLFIKNDKNRGDLPIGVSWNEKNNKYRADCKVFNIKNKKNNQKYLGLYNTPEEAFNAYKKTKEENIKLVADYYKDRIPNKLYEAMYKYEVEIAD